MIVSLVTVLGKKLGLEVIAEGVETRAQLDFLAGEGCRQVQGFYFSRPLPADEIDRLLREGSDRIAPQVGPRRLRPRVARPSRQPRKTLLRCQARNSGRGRSCAASGRAISRPSRSA